MPFASSIERDDPRNAIKIQFASVELRAAPPATAFTAPAAESVVRLDAPDGHSRIAFTLHNNHIYADASINGQAVRMLVDTGGINLLTPAAAQRLALKTEGKLAARGVGEQQSEVGFANVDELRFSAAVLHKPTLYVLDLNILEQIEGERLDGVLGYELFHHFGVEIDYAASRLTLSKPEQFSPPAGASALPFELAERIPIITGELDGLPVRLTVDTGSRASLTVHSPFAREHDLGAKYQAGPEAVIGWGAGGPAKGRLAQFGVLKLGTHALRIVNGDLHTGSKGALADASTSGNLGGGALKRFTVAFDYRKRLMYLSPNQHFESPDAHDRSGLWLRQDGEAKPCASWKLLKVALLPPQACKWISGYCASTVKK